MHSAAWLLWAVCAGLVAITTTNPFYLLPLFGVAWLVHASYKRPGPQARSFRMFFIFGMVTIATRTSLVVFLPQITTGGIVAAAVEGLRLASLLAVFGAFNSVSDPFGVLRLAPRRFHEPALAASLALSLAPRTIAAVGSVREAQRLRGIHTNRISSVTALVVPVLETGMEEAVTLAESMDARGHGRGRRSRYRPERWTYGSFAGVAAALLSLGAFLFFVAEHPEDLSVSTSPLEWPQASAWLVAATLLLAVPAGVPAGARVGSRSMPGEEA